MSVCFKGVMHQLRVRDGPEGRKLFENEIRKIFGLGKEDELQVGTN
jgi:hypothetical protein